MLLTSIASGRAQNIFVDLLTGSSTPSTVAIAAPNGCSYSGAAPVAGTTWNTVGKSTTVPQSTAPGTTFILYTNLPLQDSAGAGISPTLTVAYYSKVTTGTRTEPSNASGENTIQPGGVMQQAWRNYYNASGNYFTFTISGLATATRFGLYVEGGTGTSGQGAGVALAAGNYLGANPTNTVTTNTTPNSNAVYGSLFTANGAGGFQLMPQGTTWNLLCGQSDASGNFSFLLNGAGSAAYLNGFQLVPLAAPSLSGLTNQTVVAGHDATLSAAVSGLPAPALQWQSNGTNLPGQTAASLSLLNIQYAQDGFVYSLIASNAAGVIINSMTLTVVVTPSISGLTNQAAPVGSDVTLSASVGGVPVPVLQWQKDGTNISEATASSFVITNAQAADSGTYSLIASNSAGIATNSMYLIVSPGEVPPAISGLADQTVIEGSNATFSASVIGLPLPGLQWRENEVDLAGATEASLTLTNVSYSRDGYVYSLVASNSAGAATNSATLTVLVPPAISAQPQSLGVTNTQSASFSVTANGVPAPAYQWYFNNNPLNNATNATYTIAAASPANIGTYRVVVTNRVGSLTSSNATLTVYSTMATVSLNPSNGASGICYDTPLSVTFDRPPVLRNAGRIRIFDAANLSTPVDTLDLSLNVTNQSPYAVNVQPRTIGGETFNSWPVIINGNTAAIYPHLGVLTSNRTYLVMVDGGVFTDTSGAYFTGGTSSNAWQFTTKPTGPANNTNLVVAADGSGDFLTVQGAVDFVPAGNTAPRLINVRDGTYIEIVHVTKNNLTFRGQSRAGTILIYANNSNLNPNTHSRMSFKVNANDIALDNLTLTNSTPKGGSQAEALMLETDKKRFVANNVNVCSYQDTILANTSGTQGYFNNSLVQGDVDYIWGGGNLFLTNCEIRSLTSGGQITQARTSDTSNGIAFVNCRLTRPGTGVTGCGLGRSLGYTNGNVAFVTCRMDSHITGWGDPASRDWEYGNSNLLGTAAVSYNGTQLASGDPNLMNAQSATLWLGGWEPQLAPNITRHPTNQIVIAGLTATFSVAATGIPEPAYQWLKNGTNLDGATSSTLSLTNVQEADAGIYTVLVSNVAGTTASSGAALEVVKPAPPLLSGISLAGDGSVRFSISGTEGLGYRVWASTNVALTPVPDTWILLTNDIFGGGPIVFTDPSASAFSQRFYLISIP